MVIKKYYDLSDFLFGFLSIQKIQYEYFCLFGASISIYKLIILLWAQNFTFIVPRSLYSLSSEKDQCGNGNLWILQWTLDPFYTYLFFFLDSENFKANPSVFINHICYSK